MRAFLFARATQAFEVPSLRCLSAIQRLRGSILPPRVSAWTRPSFCWVTPRLRRTRTTDPPVWTRRLAGRWRHWQASSRGAARFPAGDSGQQTARGFRDARIAEIFEGTNEIQRILIAEQLFREVGVRIRP